MVIMARLLGLPARMINGFSQGHFDEQQNAWVVDGTDAHSWVQIYFPNYGWINFDPTPGFTLNNASSPSATATPKPSPSPASAPTAMPASTATAQAHQTGQHNQPSTHATSTDN
jgi:transglutaminase-like putative cysteine protease